MTAFFFREDSSKPPRSRRFNISGIYNSGFLEFDEKFVIADIRHIQRLNNWTTDEIGSFEVFVEDFDQIDSIGNQVYQETNSLLDSQTINERYYSIFKWLELFDFNIILIIGIMILVAGINMITALLVLILERTQMIGILKALGSSDKSVRSIFIFNAMYLVSVGLFWGNMVGIGLLVLQKQFAKTPELCGFFQYRSQSHQDFPVAAFCASSSHTLRKSPNLSAHRCFQAVILFPFPI